MIEFMATVVFAWLLWNVLKLAFQITWGAAKVIAMLFVVGALLAFVGCLVFDGGIALYAPMALMGIVWRLLEEYLYIVSIPN